METYTLTQIAERLGKAESTLRGYRDRFREFVPAKGRGRTRRYPEEAISVFSYIIALKEQGYNDPQVYERLVSKYTKTVEVMDVVKRDLLEEVRSLHENQALLVQHITQQAETIKRLDTELQHLKQSQTVSDEKISLLQKNAADITKQAAATNELLQEVCEWQRKKNEAAERRHWWNRIFH